MYRKLLFDDKLNEGLTKCLAHNFIIGPGGKLIGRKPQGSRQSPWIFINYDVRKKFCSIWNGVYCQHFNLIPTNCRVNCWKTVVKPRTVKELFECYKLFKQMDLPSKIGMDIRTYTHGAWAGFVYGDTLAQGREYYAIVRSIIPEEIPIILKRGCTEMERLLPSNTWDSLGAKDLALEERLNDAFSFDEQYFYQAGWLKNEIKERWIKRAIEIGDPTAREVAEANSSDPNIWQRLTVSSVTYHDKDPDGPSGEGNEKV